MRSARSTLQGSQHTRPRYHRPKIPRTQAEIKPLANISAIKTRYFHQRFPPGYSRLYSDSSLRYLDQKPTACAVTAPSANSTPGQLHASIQPNRCPFVTSASGSPIVGQKISASTAVPKIGGPLARRPAKKNFLGRSALWASCSGLWS